MADILIRGMEMPKVCVDGNWCGNCPMDRLWCAQRFAPKGYTMGQVEKDQQDKLPSWCPLLELPPHWRMKEIIRADAEGRLLILPCKVGDTVFYKDTYGNVYEAIVQSIAIDKSRTIFITSGIGFDETTVGKTVFLTREEAEAALKEGDNG